MKKFVLAVISLFVAVMANAITLFPHFVDVAGDYKEGTTEKFTNLGIPTKAWRVAPKYYKTVAEADAFLQDTLPFSSYTIDKEEQTLPDGTVMIKYIASLADGVFGHDPLNEGKMSVLYLIQTPGEPLYVGIEEDDN